MAVSRVKSPHNPTMNLEAAIKRARELTSALGRGPLSRDAAITGLGLSPKSGTGQRTMAALLAFGLWEKSGKGKVQLSELGRRILAAPTLDRAATELGQAALMPRIHRRVLEQWPDGLPVEDAAMLAFLRMEWDFNQDAAGSFIREVRDTFSFAKVYENATVPPESTENETEEDDEPEEALQGEVKRARVPDRVVFTVGSPEPKGAPVPTARLDLRRTVELTSFPLEGGGRIVLEAPVPTPADQFQRLATIMSTITQHLGQYLAKPESATGQDTPATTP